MPRPAGRQIPLAKLKEILRPLGMTIALKDGEYRYNFKGGTEATAGYTDDSLDAINSATDMWKRARLAAGGLTQTQHDSVMDYVQGATRRNNPPHTHGIVRVRKNPIEGPAVKAKRGDLAVAVRTHSSTAALGSGTGWGQGHYVSYTPTVVVSVDRAGRVLAGETKIATKWKTRDVTNWLVVPKAKLTKPAKEILKETEASYDSLDAVQNALGPYVK